MTTTVHALDLRSLAGAAHGTLAGVDSNTQVSSPVSLAHFIPFSYSLHFATSPHTRHTET